MLQCLPFSRGGLASSKLRSPSWSRKALDPIQHGMQEVNDNQQGISKLVYQHGSHAFRLLKKLIT
jgi:hypothetical protein